MFHSADTISFESAKSRASRASRALFFRRAHAPHAPSFFTRPIIFTRLKIFTRPHFFTRLIFSRALKFFTRPHFFTRLIFSFASKVFTRPHFFTRPYIFKYLTLHASIFYHFLFFGRTITTRKFKINKASLKFRLLNGSSFKYFFICEGNLLFCLFAQSTTSTENEKSFDIPTKQ